MPVDCESPEGEELVARRVLVVEGHEELGSLAQTVLGGVGYEVDRVTSGAEAIEYVMANPEVALVLGIRLPDMAGSDVIRALVDIVWPVSFIAMAGEGDVRTAVEMMKLGASDYLADEVGFGERLTGALENLFHELDSEPQLRTLVDQTSDALFLIEPKSGRVVGVDREARDVLGYSLDEPLGLSVSNIENALPAEGFTAVVESLDRGVPVTVDGLHLKTGGVVFPVEVRLRMIRTKGETRLLSLAGDLTWRGRVETALVESEARFRSLFEDVPGALWEADFSDVLVHLKGLNFREIDDFEEYLDRRPEAVRACADRIRVTAVNKAALSLHQAVTAEELLAGFARTFTERSHETLKQQLVAIWQGKTRHAMEGEITSLNGTIQQVLIRWSVPLGYEGNLSRVLVSLTDVTEWNRAERELKKNERFLTNTGHMARVGGWELDRETLQFTWTEETYRIHEVPLGETPSLDEAIAFYHPDDLGRMRAVVQKAFEKGEPWDSEFRLITAKGKQLWTRSICRPVVVDGKTVRLTGAVQDITEAKEAEEQCRILSTALEQSPAIVMITDPNGTIQYVNAKFRDATGYFAEEVIGKNPRLLKGGEMLPESYRKFWDTLCSGKTWQGEFHNKTKAGELYWESGSVSPIVDANGEITHFLSVREDVTARKALQAENAELEENLRRSGRLETIGNLAGGIAHDFNNILTPIMGYAEMAKGRTQSSDPLHADLDQILSAARRAKAMVNRILQFSRQTEKERRPTRIPLIAEEAIRLLRASIPSTISIEEDIDPACGWVLADEAEIHEVIVNLCTNAYQAMGTVGGTLSIVVEPVAVDQSTARRHPQLHEAEYVRLSVRDTGPGMDATTLDRIFEPFFSTRTASGGSGMGLSVVHGIVRGHDGDVLVRSTPGEGSVFEVYLPVTEAEGEPPAEDTREIQEGRESILVVDDDPVVAEVVTAMVGRLGYEVVMYTSSTEALEELNCRGGRYDLVVSDLTMPELTGLDLADHLKCLQPPIPLLLMTGYGEELDKEDCDIPSIVAKPVAMKGLAAMIRELLDGR